MRDGIKLVEFKLVVGANIDVGAFIFCAVAIFRSRENYPKVSTEDIRARIEPYQ